MKSHLLLASGSYARKLLMQEMGISFNVVPQNADESACDWTLPLPQVVKAIAEAKMNHVELPVAEEGQIIFVLTADTLCMDKQGGLQGKPIDYADAVAKIKASRVGARAGTAFCLERKQYSGGVWHTQQRTVEYVEAEYIFNVPDNLIDTYMATSRCLETAGAIVIEGYGQQFLRSVNGSYSTIMGLPVYEVRQALERMEFEF